MTPVPPPGYAGYYRPGQGEYGTPEKLQALADGYFGLNRVFIINIGVALAANVVTRNVSESNALAVVGVVLVGLFLLVLFLTLPQNKLIAAGKDWDPSKAVIASVLMGINSALCCGIIGYIVMQQIAFKEMQKYGIKGGTFGLKRGDVDRQIAEIKERRRAMPNTYPR